MTFHPKITGNPSVLPPNPSLLSSSLSVIASAIEPHGAAKERAAPCSVTSPRPPRHTKAP